MPYVPHDAAEARPTRARPTLRRVMDCLTLTGILMIAGCAENTVIRSDISPCQQKIRDGNASACSRSILETNRWTANSHTGAVAEAGYTLGFVEFDDEGKMFDPNQQRLLFNAMAEDAQTQDLSIVVFVHGWKHDAQGDDGNVKDFRKLLGAIAQSEIEKDPGSRRKVIGVYSGWRGLSVRGDILSNISFWERKDAAQRVAEGAIRGLLGKLRAFRDTIDAEPGLGAGDHTKRATRMLTIGHSFGGLIVYSALAQYFIDRAAIAAIHADYFPLAPALDHGGEKTDDREISSYGDLVVLVNPAIEAMRYDALNQLVKEQADGHSRRRYAPCQSPVLVQVTSEGETLLEGDWATGIAFPAGRALNTGLERTTEGERLQLRTSMGHYRDYWTHDLNGIPGAKERSKADRTEPLTLNFAGQEQSFRTFETQRIDGYLPQGWHGDYGAATLKEIGGNRADPNNPFWVVRTHPNIILDHNDISAPIFVNFVAQLYADIDRLKAAPECQKLQPS